MVGPSKFRTQVYLLIDRHRATQTYSGTEAKQQKQLRGTRIRYRRIKKMSVTWRTFRAPLIKKSRVFPISGGAVGIARSW